MQRNAQFEFTTRQSYKSLILRPFVLRSKRTNATLYPARYYIRNVRIVVFIANYFVTYFVEWLLHRLNLILNLNDHRFVVRTTDD